jgi:DNA-binding IclR family transcriptional regulator
VPSVDAACRILDVLAPSNDGGLTLSQISREVNLSKSSAHGVLATLLTHDFVERDHGSRCYRLGPALARLGWVVSQPTRTARVHERITALAARFGLTFAVARMTERGDAEVTDRAYPDSDLHVGLQLGSRYGPFDGAIGKCLLAALVPGQAEATIRGAEIPRHTHRTIVEPDALVREIERVRERGWAVSEGELKDNYAVAAPLLNADGSLDLVLFAVGFPGQLGAGSVEAVGTALRDTAGAVREVPGVGPTLP